MRLVILLILSTCCGCAGGLVARAAPGSRAAQLQAQIGCRSSTAEQVCRASKELVETKIDEDPDQWIRQAEDIHLSQLARGLSFDAFWRRFVHPPVSLRFLVEKYHMHELLLPSLIMDDNRESGDIFEGDNRLPSGALARQYIWAPTPLRGGLFFVCLKVSEVDSVDRLIAGARGRARAPDVIIYDFRLSSDWISVCD